MSQRIFIYGTLHPDRAPREIRGVVRTLEFVGQGKVRGHIYDLGEFPGLVLDRKANEVTGSIFSLPDPAVLSQLDQYEEYAPNCPETSLFLRKQTSVTLANGKSTRCWIYVYNGPRSSTAELKSLPAVA